MSQLARTLSEQASYVVECSTKKHHRVLRPLSSSGLYRSKFFHGFVYRFELCGLHCIKVLAHIYRNLWHMFDMNGSIVTRNFLKNFLANKINVNYDVRNMHVLLG